MQAAPLNESFENSDNIVNIKIQGSDSNSVKQFKVLKVRLMFRSMHVKHKSMNHLKPVFHDFRTNKQKRM